jgi:hypothetical protein
MTEGKQQGFGEAADLARVLAKLCERMNETATFLNRGLSERTIGALVSHGMNAPERLLFKSEAELRRVPGIGDVSIKEIEAYKAKFEDRPPNG